jgi:hypothetical protein
MNGVKHIVHSIKINPESSIAFCVAMTIYLLNQLVIKRLLYDFEFFYGYLNDFLAPFVLLSYSSLLLGIVNKKLKKLWQIYMIMIPAAIVWEIVMPMLVRTSVGDIFDVVCYFFGAYLYWLFVYNQKGETRDEKKKE